MFRSDPYPIVLDTVNALITLISAVYADVARPGLGEKLQSICQEIRKHAVNLGSIAEAMRERKPGEDDEDSA